MSGLHDLSPRLRMVADLVPPGIRLADVGTDHAYLPTALLQEGKIPFAVAADLRQGPLASAKATVRRAELEGKVAFRLCDGLRGIRPEEVDGVAIAGMGGETIASILAAAPWTREMDVPLILQPMSSMPDLRQWLGENGYRIITEELCQEGDTLYTAMLVQAGEMEQQSPGELWAGKNRNHPLRGAWLDQWLSRIDRALHGMEQAQGEGVRPKQEQLLQVRAELLQMRKEWDQWQK